MANYDYLWERVKYSAPTGCILDSRIVEYDIEKANISVFLDKGVISQEEYEYYYNMDKHSREVAMGMLQLRVNGASLVLKEGIKDARRLLFEKLNLDENNVLAINNDAIYCISNGFDVGLDYVQITDHVRFKKKGVFRSYYRFGKYREFFYDYDPISKKEILEVKGIGTRSLELHQDYFVKILKDLFYLVVTRGRKAAYDALQNFYHQYLSMKLPIEYYRRLDSESLYDLKLSTEYGYYRADQLLYPDRRLIDPSYNAWILNCLARYLTREDMW